MGEERTRPSCWMLLWESVLVQGWLFSLKCPEGTGSPRPRRSRALPRGGWQGAAEAAERRRSPKGSGRGGQHRAPCALPGGDRAARPARVRGSFVGWGPADGCWQSLLRGARLFAELLRCYPVSLWVPSICRPAGGCCWYR